MGFIAKPAKLFDSPDIRKMFVINRDLLKLFTTNELMQWSSLTSICAKELRDGLPGSPATGVFEKQGERGNKRWDDFRKRVVEHVSFCCF